jgi:hypothetical protein
MFIEAQFGSVHRTVRNLDGNRSEKQQIQGLSERYRPKLTVSVSDSADSSAWR